MTRVIVALALLCASSCATASETATQPSASPSASPPMVAAADTAPEANEQTASMLNPKVVEAAMGPHRVEKMKIRVEKDGSIIKQATYHDDATAVPEPAVARALTVFPGAKVTQYETEYYSNEGLVYEVEVKTTDGRSCEVSATAEGVLRYQECRVATKDLPPAVSAELKRVFPKGKILEVEAKQGTGVDEFTIELKNANDEFYVRLSPQGSLLGVHRRVPALVEVPFQVGPPPN